LHARHGVPEAWIVDLENGRLLVYGSPVEGAYARHDSIEAPEVISVTTLPGMAVDPSAVFAR
jgi:Uma2 family endonuclease